MGSHTYRGVEDLLAQRAYSPAKFNGGSAQSSRNWVSHFSTCSKPGLNPSAPGAPETPTLPSVRMRKTRSGWKGWLEDRRPASNADPYKVAAEIIKTVKSANVNANA